MIPKVESQTNHDFAITLLSDAQHKVIDRYCPLAERAAQWGRYLPIRTTCVIDKTQTIRWKFTEVDYKIRPTNEVILAALRKIE